MIAKFSALIGVKQETASAEPEYAISCGSYPGCTDPRGAVFFWFNNQPVYQYCGCDYYGS